MTHIYQHIIPYINIRVFYHDAQTAQGKLNWVPGCCQSNTVLTMEWHSGLKRYRRCNTLMYNVWTASGWKRQWLRTVLMICSLSDWNTNKPSSRLSERLQLVPTEIPRCVNWSIMNRISLKMPNSCWLKLLKCDDRYLTIKWSFRVLDCWSNKRSININASSWALGNYSYFLTFQRQNYYSVNSENNQWSNW